MLASLIEDSVMILDAIRGYAIVQNDEAPDVFGAYSYDAAMAVFKAIEASGSTEPDKIRDALLKVSFVGASGDIAFHSNGDMASKAFGRKTIKGGKAVNVSK